MPNSMVFKYLAATIILLSSALAQESSAAGRWFNPPNALAETTTDFSSNPVWIIGETQTLKYTTVYQNYAITIWQQDITSGGSATSGPVIFQAQNGAVTRFDWSVQTFQFDLQDSNVFFLWLTPSDAGSDAVSVTSHYFNVTQEAASSTSSTTSSTHPAAYTTPAEDAATSASSGDNRVSTGLSPGAQAGIGVGAAAAALIIAGAAAYSYRRSRKKRHGPSVAQGQSAYTDGPTQKPMQHVPAELMGDYQAGNTVWGRPPSELPT